MQIVDSVAFKEKMNKRLISLITPGDGAKSAVSCPPPPQMGCTGVDPQFVVKKFKKKVA